MTSYLSLALLLCVLLPHSNGFCTVSTIEPGATHCLDEVDNKWHPVGSSWRNSDCMDCSCSGCCSAVAIPRNFPEDCVSVLDTATCKYSVHRRDDPSIECPVFGVVGK
ncbi:beta-microseminoprotein-like [Syngnathus scovelli]|uniref:beta-microseminoprotein-like n=1 Tax=Syngnathus scovelli TaxID=161590 RepID=UPI0035CB7900